MRQSLSSVTHENYLQLQDLKVDNNLTSSLIIRYFNIQSTTKGRMFNHAITRHSRDTDIVNQQHLKSALRKRSIQESSLMHFLLSKSSKARLWALVNRSTYLHNETRMKTVRPFIELHMKSMELNLPTNPSFKAIAPTRPMVIKTGRRKKKEKFPKAPLQSNYASSANEAWNSAKNQSLLLLRREWVVWRLSLLKKSWFHYDPSYRQASSRKLTANWVTVIGTKGSRRRRQLQWMHRLRVRD